MPVLSPQLAFLKQGIFTQQSAWPRISIKYERDDTPTKLNLTTWEEKEKDDGPSGVLEQEKARPGQEEQKRIRHVRREVSRERQKAPGIDAPLPGNKYPDSLSSLTVSEGSVANHTLPFHTLASDEDIQGYLEDLAKIPALSLTEEQEHLRRIAAHPRSKEAQDARTRLIEGNLRLVLRIARRYQPFGLPLLDLIQEGNLALVSAVQRFDPGRGQYFRVFATRAVCLALRHMVEVHLREHHLLEMDVVSISPLSAQTFKALMRNDLDEEAAVFDLPEERLYSLDALLAEMDRDDWLPDNMLTSRHYNKIEDATPGSEDSVAAQERSMVVAACLQSLSHREREVVLLRFGCFGQGYPQTLEEVGRILRLSRERVRQIEERAIRKLRHPSCSRRLREVL
jgi:RNA polymerase primary sigma factor